MAFRPANRGSAGAFCQLSRKTAGRYTGHPNDGREVKAMNFMRLGAFLTAAALLAACTSREPFTPTAAPAVSAPTDQRASWIDTAAKSGDLLYVSNLDIPGVLVYQYPSGKLAGEIFGRGQIEGLCPDAGGNVWMSSNSLGVIFEYAHGGSHPIATLKDPGEVPWGCALDPKTGDLAIANFESSKAGPGSISIYKGAKGKPAIYSDSSEFLYIYFVAYGSDGTIYLDGLTNANGFGFAAFHNGKFTPVTLDQSIQYARAIGVVGSDVDLVDDDSPGNPVIYRFTIDGSTGKKVGETPLQGSYIIGGFDVVGKALVVANSKGYSGQNGDVESFKYPNGGSPVKTFTYLPYFIPQAVTISEVTK
jgi:hypothetical protein